MKRIITLFALLCLSTGLWAQFVPDANTEYTLECCSGYAHSSARFIGIQSEALNGQCSTGARLKFESTNGGYYIKIVDVNKYFNWSNGAVLNDTPSTVWEFRSPFITNKVALAPVGTGSDKALNNNGGTNNLQMGNFKSEVNACSHWTIRGIQTPSGYSRYIGGITTGSFEVDEKKWKTQSNWDLKDTWNSNGPGYNGSDMWSPIYLQDVTATGIAFEGWNLRLKLVNSSLTATTKKLQAGGGGEVTINVDKNSTLDLTMSGGNADPGLHTFNIDGVLKIKTNSGHFTNTANVSKIYLGTTGQFTFTSDNAVTVSRSFTLYATLTDPTEHNTVKSRTLATFTNVTVNTLSTNISDTDEWTLVENKDALETQTTNGKYYYVEEEKSSSVKLFTYHRNKKYEVTYKVVGANNEELASFTRDEEDGTTITTLPAEYQRTLFYTYNQITETVDAAKTVTFTATLRPDSELPFIPSASFADAVWYNLTLHNTPNYVTYTASGTQNVTLPVSLTDNATTQWAFIGTPYTGFKIVNRAAGSSLVLGSAQTTNSDYNGRNVYATLQPENTQHNEVWTPEATTATEPYYAGKNGFFLRNAEGHALNKRNDTSNISYWTTGADNGSTFVATRLTLSGLVTKANTLYTTLNTGHENVQIGYPTASALSTFSDAIAAAQGVIDNSGDEMTGWDALQAAIATVQSVANTVYTPRTDVYYTITSARGSMIYEPTYTKRVNDDPNGNEFVYHTGNNKAEPHKNITFDAANANHQWGFILFDGKYYMYNVGKRQFANVTQGGSYQLPNGDRHTWMFSNTPSSVVLDAGINNCVATPNVRVRATSEVTGLQYAMSISPDYHGPVIAYDEENDGGIPMTFAVATTVQDADVTAAIEALLEDLTPYRDALQDAIDAADALEANFGSGLNKYTVTGGQDNFDAALAAAKTEVEKADNETSKAALISACESLETAQSALTQTLNMPTAGFYRIKGKTSGKYLAADFANGKFAMTDAVDGTTVFYFDGSMLVNYSTGMANGMNADTWAWVTGDAASEVTFHDGNSNGGYAIKSTNAFFYDGGTNADRGSSIGSEAEYRNWYLEEVTTLPIALNAFDGSYYSTFYSPVNVEVSEATAYTLTLKSNYLSATEIDDDVIPANTGVILVSNSNDATVTATLTLTDKTPTVSSSTGDLTGTVATATSSESDYIFTVVDNEIGFYKNGYETVKGFKAFYRPSDSSVRGFAINFGLNDAITDILHQVSPKNVYDLQGRRVNEPAKGLYIINGKKVIK